MTAVIFDLDGVLVNSEPYWQEGFLEVTREFCNESGLPEPDLTLDDMARFQGGRVNDTMRTILGSVGHEGQVDRETIEVLADRVIRRVSTSFTDHPEAIDANVRVARALADRDVPLAVASSSADRFIKVALERIGLADAVTVTQSAYDLEHGKPHPEVYLLTLARMGVAAHDTIAIEDSTTGIGSAVRAELATIWYLASDEYEEAALERLRTSLGDDADAAGNVRRITRDLTLEDVDLVMAEL